MKSKSGVRLITEKYEDNCLEAWLGKDLVWFKEINDKGRVIENILMQDVDGGMRGVDIFGDEHFESFSFDQKNISLSQTDGKVKKYARDNRGMFHRADENFNIIQHPKAEKYNPVVLKETAAYDESNRSPQINRVLNVSKDR